jgi:high affinity sulfate transporter 1
MKILDWLLGYRREWLRPDIVAGLVTAAVVIPKAMAYATVAGLPVQVGLYTAFVPVIIYAVLGSSRVLSVSTTTTIAILTGANLALVAPDGDPTALLRASATLSVMVGVLLVLASVLRLGFLATFISEPVLSGFKAGIGVVIVLDQVPKLLGVHFPKGTFLENLLALARSLPDTSAATLAVGLAMIALLLGLKRFAARVPAPLVTVGAGIAAMALLGLGAYGVESVGEIPRGLPALTPPDFALVEHLWPGALGIALMSFTETMAAGRAFAQSGEPPIRPNQELLATGLATAGGGLLGGMAAGGGTSQTAVNRLAGARSQLAGLITGGGALLTLLFLAPLIGLMPQATLAAVVIVYSVGLIELSEFRAILAVRRTEFIWAVAAFAGVMLLGTLKGILVAIAISLVSLAHQVADPPVYRLGRKRGTSVFRPLSAENPDDETFDGLLLVRPVGRLFFANGQRVGEKLRLLIADAKPRVVVLHLGAVFDVEYTVLKMLAEGEARIREHGVSLWLAGLTPDVLTAVRRSPLGQALGRERMFFNLEQAVAAYQALYARGEKASAPGPTPKRCDPQDLSGDAAVE